MPSMLNVWNTEFGVHGVRLLGGLFVRRAQDVLLHPAGG